MAIKIPTLWAELSVRMSYLSKLSRAPPKPFKSRPNLVKSHNQALKLSQKGRFVMIEQLIILENVAGNSKCPQILKFSKNFTEIFSNFYRLISINSKRMMKSFSLENSVKFNGNIWANVTKLKAHFWIAENNGDFRNWYSKFLVKQW